MKFCLKLTRSTSEENPVFYKLLSKDNKTLKISEEAVNQSDFLRNLCFNSNVAPLTGLISIDLFESKALKMAIRWCELHKFQVPPTSYSISKFMKIPLEDRRFFNINGDDLLALLRVADFLGIRNLYYYGLKIIASMLENKSEQDVRLIFQLGETRFAALKQVQWRKMITMRPIYDLPNLRSFDAMSMNNLLEDLLFFMRKPMILRMSLCSLDLFNRIKFFRREVTADTCSEDDYDYFTLGEIIELLRLEQMMDPGKFYDRIEFDVIARQRLHFVIYYKSQSSSVHLHLSFYYTCATGYLQKKEVLKIGRHRFSFIKNDPKIYFYQDDDNRKAAKTVYRYLMKLFHLEEKLPKSVPECEFFIEQRPGFSH